MLPAEAAFLSSPRGRELLAVARSVRTRDPLARRRHLDLRASPEEARAVLAQDELRVRAARKTPLCERLLFTKEALEQASPSPVAEERAARFAPFATVADLGAGIGLDTIALAQAGRRVTAVERDPVRAALLRHNVEAAEVGDRVSVVEGDAIEHPPRADAAYLDPDRRPGNRRTRDPDRFEPRLEAWADLATRYAALLVKLAPGTRPGTDAASPFEWVSLDGELRESRAAFGSLAPSDATRRAVILPGTARVEGLGVPWPDPRAAEVGDWLLDPDPAVVVAGLVGDAALSIGAAPLHPRIAYLVARAPAPWATGVRIDLISSADAKELREIAAAHDIGVVEVRTRGVEDGAEAWRRRIRPRGRRRAAVVITRGPDDRYLSFFSFAAGESGLT